MHQQSNPQLIGSGYIRKMSVAPVSNRCFHDYSDRLLLVILTTLALTALATPTPSVAQPIDPTMATGTFTGGGITLTADDLRRFATEHAAHRAAVAADSTTSTSNPEPTNGAGPRGGGIGNVLIVECNGLFGYGTIQGAIDAAVDGDVVVVLPNDCTPEGRWFENIDFLGKAIRVQNANPDDPSVVNATIIDGSNNGPVVKFENNETRDAEINGLTITNGNGGSLLPIKGGGISCISGSPTIRNCVIRDNTAPLGGGLRSLFGIPLIESCAFLRNNAIHGGAINAETGMTPIIRGCQFIENSAQSYPTIKGGFCQASQDPLMSECNSIEDCVFEGNLGNLTVWNFPIIERCHFRSNIANPWCIQGSKKLIDCTFEQNQSSILLAGGTNSAVIRCAFTGNQSPTTGTINIAAATVEDCLFDQNSATSGGAIFTAGPSIIKHTIFSSTFALFHACF